jgi:hypothetical protein
VSDIRTPDRLVEGDLNHFRHGDVEVRADAFEQPYLEGESGYSEGVPGEPEHELVADNHRDAQLPFSFKMHANSRVEAAATARARCFTLRTLGVGSPVLEPSFGVARPHHARARAAAQDSQFGTPHYRPAHVAAEPRPG